MEANSGDPDQTPHCAVSDIVLHCLPMSPKKDARLIWVNGLGINLHENTIERSVRNLISFVTYIFIQGGFFLFLSIAEEFRDRKFSMVNLRKVSESHKTLDRRQSLQQSAFHNILQATKRVMSPPPESVKVLYLP